MKSAKQYHNLFKKIYNLFDGRNDYLTIDDNQDFQFGDKDFTIEFSVRFPEIDRFMTNRFLRRQ